MSVIRQLDSFLYDEIAAGLNKYGLNNVSIVTDYPDQNLIIPSVAISFSKELDDYLELSEKTKALYYYELDIYANFKGQRDDITTALTSFLDQSSILLDNNNWANITEIKPIESKPDKIIPSNVHKKYYNLTFNGYNSYGISSHHVKYRNNTISIDTDFSCGKFVTSGSVEQISGYCYNTSYDATLIYYGPGNITITTGGNYLQVYKSSSTTLQNYAFFAIYTSGLKNQSNIDNINLYFYVNSGIYPYRSNIYILRDYNVPITKSAWKAANSLIGELTITGNGWYNITIPQSLWTYLDNVDHTIIKFSAVTTNSTLYLNAFEIGINKAYIKTVTSPYEIYHTSFLVDKFDDVNLRGFKLWLDSGGYVNYTRGFSGSVINVKSDSPIVTGLRNHLSVSSKYYGTLYSVDMFLNNRKIRDYDATLYILPAYTNLNVYIGANNNNAGTISGYGNFTMYNLRITTDYFNAQPAKRGEFLAQNQALDIMDLRFDEGSGSIAYDFRQYNDLSLNENYVWNNYLSLTEIDSQTRLHTAKMRILIETVEDRE